MYYHLKEAQSKHQKNLSVNHNEEIKLSHLRQRSILPSFQCPEIMNIQPRIKNNFIPAPIKKQSISLKNENKKLAPLVKSSVQNNSHTRTTRKNTQFPSRKSSSIENPYYDISNKSPNQVIKNNHLPSRFYPASQLKKPAKKPLLYREIAGFGSELTRVLASKNSKQAALIDSSQLEAISREPSFAEEDFSLFSLKSIHLTTSTNPSIA